MLVVPCPWVWTASKCWLIHQCNRCLKRYESICAQSLAEYCMYDVLCHAQSEISFLKWPYVECGVACADLLCCVRCNHSNVQRMKCYLHWGWDCSLTSMLWRGFHSTRGYVQNKSGVWSLTCSFSQLKLPPAVRNAAQKAEMQLMFSRSTHRIRK